MSATVVRQLTPEQVDKMLAATSAARQRSKARTRVSKPARIAAGMLAPEVRP